MDDMKASAEGLFGSISTEDAEEAQRIIASGGVAAFSQFLIKNQNKWKETPLNVGFIGNSGVGKSSTINSILGIRPGSAGAAQVGTTQTTMEPTAYQHPDNPNLKMWDLPGVGTPEYPRDSYFRKIKFERFDFFLILDMMRFREEDVWIGKEIVKLGKEFFYVRTMIDNDVRNNEYDKGWDMERTLKEIRDDIQANVERQGLKHTGIYLISNRQLTEFDFPRLMKDLVTSFPRLKRGALALTLRAHSEGMVELKVEELRKRIKWAAALSATAGAIPLPGVGIAADLMVIIHELQFYYSQLGLKQEDLRELGLMTGVDPAILINTAASIYPTTFLTTEAIRQALVEAPLLAAETAVEEVAKYVPLIGTVISSALSFGTMTWYLNRALSQMEEAAKRVLSEALNRHVVA